MQAVAHSEDVLVHTVYAAVGENPALKAAAGAALPVCRRTSASAIDGHAPDAIRGGRSRLGAAEPADTTCLNSNRMSFNKFPLQRPESRCRAEQNVRGEPGARHLQPLSADAAAGILQGSPVSRAPQRPSAR